MKEVVAYVTACHGYSQRRACCLTRQHRSTPRKPSRKDPRTELRQRMRDIVRTRIHYGYRRVHVMLSRDGWSVGRNLVYRLYREEGLALRSRQPRRRKMLVHRQARHQPTRPNQAWTLDFVHDQLGNGQKFRALTVIDVFSRESLAIAVGQRLRGEHVVEFSIAWSNNAARQHTCLLTMVPSSPDTLSIFGLIIMAHGSTSPARANHGQCLHRELQRVIRDECLNVHWFATIAEARALIEAWRIDYNVSRPHMALGNIAPLEYALRAVTSQDPTGSIAVVG